MSIYVGLKKGKIHEKHEMSEYYCGGCGWPVTDHDSYCRECGGALHEGMAESRWHELFGTPERTARTLVERLDVGVIEWCNNDCDNCPYEYNQYGCEQVLTLLEWLRSV